ncbi:MAG TPA: NAD(P)-dependent oxidoreductase [Planctomycetaceae bacterium]|nr:NAD(P)-dependent oxidoreductase [Planctomycetaceae bacterium]
MAARTVGLIGVGLVGTALAERFLAAGWSVVGYDTSAAQLDHLRDLGGDAAMSATDVFAATDVIVLSLPTSVIATQVMEAVTGPLAGKIVIDTTTGEPAEVAALGERLAGRGAKYLDTTIAGSSAQVRSGEVIVTVGGDAATVAACDELFCSFAARVFHVGDCGAGAQMKLVVNLVLGLNRAVLAEGLCFAARTGVDPQLALEVLRAGPTYSRVMDTKGARMLGGDFAPQARLAQHLKDVRLILATGATAGATLPLSSLHEQLLEELDRAGYGDLDNSAIIKAFQGHRTPSSES